ncbi:hypothetical protein OG539_11420 [Actinacidiphila glaucinigra]|uniref:hypothetical protein n=1 Tax=Actinacidiphila glaucinigra TaxID=235986 RepID=UPI002DD946B7|nr:hypothetical protein [Actinacidiphila glaucinigra]WSD63055.1 hypothetical protein OIE69_31265 [Actinacidiphila glaucinigra]
MQPSAGPALPHTRARSVHWITTAAVIAAVIGSAALVQPAGASTGSPADAKAGKAAPAAVAPPDPRAAHFFPLECAGAPVDVVDRASADLDGDGRPETVAVARCHSETGTPPSGLYVLSADPAAGADPRIVETLVDPKEQRSFKGLRIDGRTVRATVLGYSTDDVPRCCPDQQRDYSWEWRSGTYYEIPGPLANSV